MKKIKFILVNDNAAKPRFNGPKAQFKVQGSLTKVRATRGSMTRFSDLKVQSDPRVDDNGPLAQFKIQDSSFRCT